MSLGTIPKTLKMIALSLEGSHLQKVFANSYHMTHIVIKCQLQMACSETQHIYSPQTHHQKRKGLVLHSNRWGWDRWLAIS